MKIDTIFVEKYWLNNNVLEKSKYTHWYSEMPISICRNIMIKNKNTHIFVYKMCNIISDFV